MKHMSYSFRVICLHFITCISWTANAQQISNLPGTTDTTVQIKTLKLFEGPDKIKQQNKKIRSLTIPAALITYGFFAMGNDELKKINTDVRYEIKEDHPGFITKVDNYLQYSPAVAVYGLNLAGIKGKNNFRDRTMIYTISSLISSAFVLPIKRITNVQRPDGSDFHSFPSGHTTTAFASAEFLRQEYKDVSPWYGVAGYAAAAATGIIRVYNNKHWVSDIVAGAGFGIISTKLAYWIYPSIKRKYFKNKANAMVLPYYQPGSGGVSMIYRIL